MTPPNSLREGEGSGVAEDSAAPRVQNAAPPAGINESHPLLTMRGPLAGYHALPGGLRSALISYDGLRRRYSPDLAEQVAREDTARDLRRLLLGLRTLSFLSVCHVVRRRSHVDAEYVRGKMGTLNTLIGLFWWNDGVGRVRARLLLLAWRRGAAALRKQEALDEVLDRAQSAAPQTENPK